MEVRGRRSREMSPERVRNSPQPKVIRPTFKRVQVVYYLSRNGQLEHPHYMEVTHLAHQQLRLKDVIDRLVVLRGKGMPSMYSWSCKRSYKNGYVWNDLTENDVIYPSEGAEYILKGSEVLEGCTDKLQQLQLNSMQQLQQLQLGNNQRPNQHHHHQITNFHPKPKPHQLENTPYDDQEFEENEHMNNDNKEIEYEKKISYTTSTPTPHPRRSRGVSTDEFTTLDDSSPPSATSSTVSDKANDVTNIETSKRFEDGDPVGTEPLLSRSSMLFQLIACGGSLSFRKTAPTTVVGRKSDCSIDVHKGVVVCKEEKGMKVLIEEEDEIRCMSENPRFGNSQREEKEYFSGSIVESMANEAKRTPVQPCFKKSSSYNEERSSKSAFVEAAEEEIPHKENGVKGKCMPRKKSTSKQLKK